MNTRIIIVDNYLSCVVLLESSYCLLSAFLHSPRFELLKAVAMSEHIKIIVYE